jgi:hypothetical protein
MEIPKTIRTDRTLFFILLFSFFLFYFILHDLSPTDKRSIKDAYQSFTALG